MDPSDLPFGTPVILKSLYRNSLLSAFVSREASCSSDRSDEYAWLELVRAEEGNITIRAVRSTQFLLVRSDGMCAFEADNVKDAEPFELMRGNHGSLVFVSCRTGQRLTTCEGGLVWCCERVRFCGQTSEWEIVSPMANTDIELRNLGTQLSQVQSLLDPNLKYILESLWKIQRYG